MQTRVPKTFAELCWAIDQEMPRTGWSYVVGADRWRYRDGMPDLEFRVVISNGARHYAIHERTIAATWSRFMADLRPALRAESDGQEGIVRRVAALVDVERLDGEI